MAKDALGGHLWCLEKDNDAIPSPTGLRHVELDSNESVVLIVVHMPTIRLSQENRSINRTVTLPAWLNAVALERGVNFSQTLQSALMDELGVKHKNIQGVV